uniref:Uncharacterized protein n=1 Tax=Sphaerodactylus townsendi TaxID=933632 RepID=A0ACB8F7Z2_9SAUR
MGSVDNFKDFVSVGPIESVTRSKDAPAATCLAYRTTGDEGGTTGTFLRSVPTRASLRTPRGSVVSFHSIQYSIKQSHGLLCKRTVVEKKILQNVYISCDLFVTGASILDVPTSGIMKPGMNAILGPTGSGKSS